MSKIHPLTLPGCGQANKSGNEIVWLDLCFILSPTVVEE
jgi:hypothetical protein